MFKETDRVQRIQTPVSIVLLVVDGFSDLVLKHNSNVADMLLKLLRIDCAANYGAMTHLAGMPMTSLS
jgi:hypothetical protein